MIVVLIEEAEVWHMKKAAENVTAAATPNVKIEFKTQNAKIKITIQN